MKSTNEYDTFDGLVSGLLRVPHSEIKAKLDAEKKAKKRKKIKTSGSRVSNGKD